jgi:hypothetical protein
MRWTYANKDGDRRRNPKELQQNSKADKGIRQVMAGIEEHEKKGVYYRSPLDWSEVFTHALDLSKKIFGRLEFESFGHPSCCLCAIHSC